MSATATHDREVLVIGGGQAGLAIGYHLAERGSALLGWIKDDARHIADEIGAFRHGPVDTSILARSGASGSAAAMTGASDPPAVWTWDPLPPR